jgi:hypothetical protein
MRVLSRPCCHCGHRDGVVVKHRKIFCSVCRGIRGRVNQRGPRRRRVVVSTVRAPMPRPRAGRTPHRQASFRRACGVRDDGSGDDGDGGGDPPSRLGPTFLDIFVARCEARALLWQVGEYDLHEAVDVLQADADASGLVLAIGDDGVQRILGCAFAAVRDDLSGWQPLLPFGRRAQ